MKSAAGEIQTALFTALNLVANGLTFTWYADDAVQGLNLPYGIIGEISYVKDEAQGVSGGDHTFTLHHYASKGSDVRASMKQVETLLDNGTLVLTGGNSAWWVKFTGAATVIREDAPDYRYSHGIQRFRIRTVDTS